MKQKLNQELLTTMKKRTTLINKNVMVQLKPRQYLRFLMKVNKDIDKIDRESTIEKAFEVAILGENDLRSVEIDEVETCTDGTMFIISKN